MNRDDRVLVEIQVEGRSLPHQKHEGAIMRFLESIELVELLRERRRMSEAEVRQLLESYRPSAANLS